MIVYPTVLEYLIPSPVQAGVFHGGTIHDAAKVVSAGTSIFNETGIVATQAKLRGNLDRTAGDEAQNDACALFELLYRRVSATGLLCVRHRRQGGLAP